MKPAARQIREVKSQYQQDFGGAATNRGRESSEKTITFYFHD